MRKAYPSDVLDCEVGLSLAMLLSENRKKANDDGYFHVLLPCMLTTVVMPYLTYA